jgi:glutamine synthetase
LDLRFTDIPSLQHHVSYPIGELTESSFEEGFGMDGSSIRGWAAINESDMLLVPDPTTALMDPFAETATLVMLGDVIDPDHQAALRARPPLDRQERPNCI